jgi:hypothetical protein
MERRFRSRPRCEHPAPPSQAFGADESQVPVRPRCCSCGNAGVAVGAPCVGGCREKPLEKARSTLPDLHLRAAVRDAVATERLRATDEMAVFGTHPYKRFSALARGFPDSHVEEQHSRPSRLLVVQTGSLAAAGRARSLVHRRSGEGSWAARVSLEALPRGPRLPRALARARGARSRARRRTSRSRSVTHGAWGATTGPVPNACPAGRAALHMSGELASTEARRLLTADGALDRVGPDSRLPTEGLGMSGSAATLARPGGRRGGRAWAAGGAGAGPGERHRAYKLDQHRDRRRWRSETLLSDVCTRHRSRRRTERSEG